MQVNTNRGGARRRVLVTGAGGFLGAPVVRALSAQGCEIRAWVGAPHDRVQEPDSSVETLRGDIADSAAAQQAVQQIEVVVHLAGPPSVADSWKFPAAYAATHVAGTANLLQASVEHGVRKFIYVSSAEVYGRPESNPAPETAALRPRSPYGVFKLAAERLLETYSLSFGMSAVVLRPFSIYGPGMSPHSVLGTIFRQALSADRIVLGNLRPVRDYCFVDDAARAVGLACATDLTGWNVFNLGAGVGVSVKELAEGIVTLCGRPLEIEQAASELRPGASDILELTADASQARRRLGWRPERSLTDGLRQTLAWWRER
jgi:UDP-glucose 4-epimerase